MKYQLLCPTESAISHLSTQLGKGVHVILMPASERSRWARRVLEAPRWWDLENLGPGARSSLTAKGIPPDPPPHSAPPGFPQRVQPKANISTLHSSAGLSGLCPTREALETGGLLSRLAKAGTLPHREREVGEP